ncbi:hypothetical protein G0Q06_10295 [Puniceicoccales bacterium CK1056]|uniref:Uncharacterized protein n=1 Tax=Oceanipulchritudo coccoides TaxID=2706888 RepID=A0A6B2M596_9BACT|nr:hypothetical protein [Oceanipulchritudo coccoides]NDV62840.1 hypothetical protein [Oceanipulchritudo coccoides]
MSNLKFTDYNILAREDSSTSYVVVGMQRTFQHISEWEEFEQRFDSLDHVVNVIMETMEDNRVPKIHSTLLAYSKNEEKLENSGRGRVDQKQVSKEVVEHLPEKLRAGTFYRFPGSNVTTVTENGTLVGYRTIEREFPYLASVLNQAVSARKRGEAFDAVQHKFMKDALPPISF